MKSILTILLLTATLLHGQSASLRQTNKWFCSCDSLIEKDLVLSSSWNDLPSDYKIIRQDTVCGHNKFNGRILLNGVMVAMGDLNKRNQPDGIWFIQPKTGTSSCWGRMKKGRKQGKWWCLDAFYIKFHKNGTKNLGHTLP